MKKPFYRLKKFYIPVFVLTLLISLSYIFLHRPLGLIIWDKLYYEEEKTQLLQLNDIVVDEYVFLKLYEKYRFNRFNIRMALLNHMKYFNSDFNAMKIFGLDKFYLQAFVHKSNIYTTYLVPSEAYNLYKNILNPNALKEYLELLEFYENVLSFAKYLKNKQFRNYIDVEWLYYNILTLDNLSQEEVCKITRINEILDNIIEIEFKFRNFLTKDQIKMINHIKDKLNACK